jgi:hypothetical protein
MLPTTRPGSEADDQKKNDPTYGGRNILLKDNTVRIIFPSEQKKVTGRIMPSFQFDSLSEKDQAFKSSTLPYRDGAVFDPTTGHPVWTWWFFDKFEVYRFWGPENRAFFSPRTWKAFSEDSRAKTLDPIDRLNWIVRNDAKWADYKFHTLPQVASAGGPPKNKHLLPMPTRVGLCNFYGRFDAEEEDSVFLLGLTMGGFKFITTQLNKAPSSRSPAHDPNWPDYMFGDITDPSTGLLCKSSMKDVGPSRKANTLVFSDLDDFLKNHKVMKIPQAKLEQRLNFFDFENVINIPSAEEIVQYLVDESNLPIDLIKEAVGDYVSVPNRTTSPVPNKGAAAASTGGSPAPPRSVASTSTSTDSSSPWGDPEDEDDDIPMNHDTPKTTASSGGGAFDLSLLAPEELTRYAELVQLRDSGEIGQDMKAFVELLQLEQKARV